MRSRKTCIQNPINNRPWSASTIFSFLSKQMHKMHTQHCCRWFFFFASQQTENLSLYINKYISRALQIRSMICCFFGFKIFEGKFTNHFLWLSSLHERKEEQNKNRPSDRVRTLWKPKGMEMVKIYNSHPYKRMTKNIVFNAYSSRSFMYTIEKLHVPNTLYVRTNRLCSFSPSLFLSLFSLSFICSLSMYRCMYLGPLLYMYAYDCV